MNKGRIIIGGKKVSAVETNVLWNGAPWTTIEIRRCFDDKFVSHLSTPEGGGSKMGTLPEVLCNLHPKVARGYSLLFELADPNLQSVSDIGFAGYELVN